MGIEDFTDSMMGVAGKAVTAGVVMKISDKVLGGAKGMGTKRLKPASVKGIPKGLPKLKPTSLTKARKLPMFGEKFDVNKL